jgi:hypothetical protein
MAFLLKVAKFSGFHPPPPERVFFAGNMSILDGYICQGIEPDF